MLYLAGIIKYFYVDQNFISSATELHCIAFYTSKPDEVQLYLLSFLSILILILFYSIHYYTIILL